MTLTKNEWSVYGILRNNVSKEKAEAYKQKCFARKAKYNCAKPINPWHIAISDEYGYISKMFVPYEMNEHEKEAFKETNWKTVYSMYDCTGRPFTNWIEFFSVPNGTWIYHSIGFDI